MNPTSFDKWWKRFRRSVDRETNAREVAGTLRRHWLGLPEADRQPFLGMALEHLLQRERSYGVALFMLEAVTDPAYLAEFARHLQPLPDLQDEDEESHLADLMRVLGAAGDASLTEPISHYLLQRPIGPYWSSVPWALWPHDKKLFGRAWSRFFEEHDAGNGSMSRVLRSFLTEPEAIGVVKRFLAGSSRKRWEALRQALLRQAGRAQWLSPEQRQALERATR